jgi:hypothetical protein
MTQINPLQAPRQSLLDEVLLLLGGEIVDIELESRHLNVAFEVAMGRYRQRSGNSLEESFLFIDVQPDVASYKLADEVQEVRYVYRRSATGTGAGASIDPFSLSYTNTIYMQQNIGGLGMGGGAGNLAIYDLAMQYQNLIGRMFGREIMYTWDAATKIITFERRFTAVEQVALHVYNARPEAVLLADPYARPWLREYCIAVCKQMMGEARSKFSTVAGPQGGFSLNGDAMKAEARADMDRLEKELLDFVDGHNSWPLCIG